MEEILFLTLIILIIIALICIAIILWFLPVFIAKKRHTEDQGIIIVLSILGIFTGITWVVALVMACFKPSNKDKKQQEIEKSYK